MSCRWVYLPSTSTTGRFCGKPGHPYCPEHEAELAAMEQAEKDWGEILASYKALCDEPENEEQQTRDGVRPLSS